MIVVNIFSPKSNCGCNDDVLIAFVNSGRLVTFCFLYFFVNVSFCPDHDGIDDVLMAFGDNSSSLIVFSPYNLFIICHDMF